MKKLLLSTAVLMTACLGTFAQGSINFINFAGGDNPVDAPVFNVDGTTRLDGNQYMAQLLAGADEASLAPVGAPAPFLSGEGAGYFGGGTRLVDGIDPGASAVAKVIAWDTTTGSDFESATIKGESGTITIEELGGDGSPPTLPANLVGLQSFSLVPEPSTIALGVLGAAALLFARRRK